MQGKYRNITKAENSRNFFPELTERCRPVNLPKWIDFKIAFRADLEAYEKPYYRFSVFSNKILVYNFDISSDLFAYVEDNYDGGEGLFVEGLPSKEDLMKNLLGKYENSRRVFGKQAL